MTGVSCCEDHASRSPRWTPGRHKVAPLDDTETTDTSVHDAGKFKPLSQHLMMLELASKTKREQQFVESTAILSGWRRSCISNSGLEEGVELDLVRHRYLPVPSRVLAWVSLLKINYFYRESMKQLKKFIFPFKDSSPRYLHSGGSCAFHPPQQLLSSRTGEWGLPENTSLPLQVVTLPYTAGTNSLLVLPWVISRLTEPPKDSLYPLKLG